MRKTLDIIGDDESLFLEVVSHMERNAYVKKPRANAAVQLIEPIRFLLKMYKSIYIDGDSKTGIEASNLLLAKIDELSKTVNRIDLIQTKTAEESYHNSLVSLSKMEVLNSLVGDIRKENKATSLANTVSTIVGSKVGEISDSVSSEFGNVRKEIVLLHDRLARFEESFFKKFEYQMSIGFMEFHQFFKKVEHNIISTLHVTAGAILSRAIGKIDFCAKALSTLIPQNVAGTFSKEIPKSVAVAVHEYRVISKAVPTLSKDQVEVFMDNFEDKNKGKTESQGGN